jgi:tRNA-2-methylthio-N6-dimethylallyladenosine synthase
MHRGYTAERYLAKLAEARRMIPELAVSTDIIVAFPGETDDDFSATLEVASAARFDDAFTFIFSPRPGTEAAALTDRLVDPAVAGERFIRLRTVIERSALAANTARIGRTEEVLVEGPSKKDPAVLAARTPQHRLVHFASPGGLRSGAYATVEITAAAPHHLTGRFVEQLAEPRHRLRIPVLAG